MSKTEAKLALERQLEESRASFVSRASYPELLAAVQSRVGGLTDNLYIIEHLPERAEDLFMSRFGDAARSRRSSRRPRSNAT